MTELEHKAVKKIFIIQQKIVAKVKTEEQRNFLLEKLNNKYVKHLRSNYV